VEEEEETQAAIEVEADPHQETDIVVHHLFHHERGKLASLQQIHGHQGALRETMTNLHINPHIHERGKEVET